ncbi:MAG TPA: type II secretion system protein [Candidatus Saccharimonadales bacterium]|nr:type II secretion system protein [Candidatus Saccharimonadales bacterium]
MTALNKINKEKGFTLIELLVVIGILAILLAITLIAINPARQFGQANDTKRRSDANAILNAIGQYSASNAGNLPGEVSSATSSATEIDSTHFPNLCTAIMPTYISALPVDPSVPAGNNTSPNGTGGITSCSTTPWDTGYAVSKDSNNRITVYAPLTSQYSTSEITVTR